MPITSVEITKTIDKREMQKSKRKTNKVKKEKGKHKL